MLPDATLRLQRAQYDISQQLARRTQAYGTLLERSRPSGERLGDHECGVYSQWGEDGILSYLINTLRPEHESFIEFGVESYTEANTRWLLEYRNWRGLVIDGSESHVRFIRDSDLYWKHTLTAVAAMVTRDNIDTLIRENGFAGPIGLLSIDIDGVDYWVWESIQSVDPLIVVVEYNSGPSGFFVGWRGKPDFRLMESAEASSAASPFRVATSVAIRPSSEGRKIGKESGFTHEVPGRTTIHCSVQTDS